MATLLAFLVSSGVGGRRKRCEPGTTDVDPPASVIPSQAKQKVITQLCSGNGTGSQFWSACRLKAPSPSPSNLCLMLPTKRPARTALPQLNSAIAITLGSVATRSMAGCRPSRSGAEPVMPVAFASEACDSEWIASRRSSINSGGAAFLITP